MKIQSNSYAQYRANGYNYQQNHQTAPSFGNGQQATKTLFDKIGDFCNVNSKTGSLTRTMFFLVGVCFMLGGRFFESRDNDEKREVLTRDVPAVALSAAGAPMLNNAMAYGVTKKTGIPIMTMGPICITPELKRQGYGKALLDYSLEKAAEYGCGALCFEGNINFYGKSGFTFARDFAIRYHGLPEGADSSFFLCKELIPGYLSGVTGEYAPPQGYFVDEEEAEEFDKGFPYKEKLKLPGQLF